MECGVPGIKVVRDLGEKKGRRLLPRRADERSRCRQGRRGAQATRHAVGVLGDYQPNELEKGGSFHSDRLLMWLTLAVTGGGAMPLDIKPGRNPAVQCMRQVGRLTWA